MWLVSPDPWSRSTKTLFENPFREAVNPHRWHLAVMCGRKRYFWISASVKDGGGDACGRHSPCVTHHLQPSLAAISASRQQGWSTVLQLIRQLLHLHDCYDDSCDVLLLATHRSAGQQCWHHSAAADADWAVFKMLKYIIINFLFGILITKWIFLIMVFWEQNSKVQSHGCSMLFFV